MFCDKFFKKSQLENLANQFLTKINSLNTLHPRNYMELCNILGKIYYKTYNSNNINNIHFLKESNVYNLKFRCKNF